MDCMLLSHMRKCRWYMHDCVQAHPGQAERVGDIFRVVRCSPCCVSMLLLMVVSGGEGVPPSLKWYIT